MQELGELSFMTEYEISVLGRGWWPSLGPELKADKRILCGRNNVTRREGACGSVTSNWDQKDRAVTLAVGGIHLMNRPVLFSHHIIAATGGNCNSRLGTNSGRFLRADRRL